MDDIEKAAEEFCVDPEMLNTYSFPQVFREHDCPKQLTPRLPYMIDAYTHGYSAIFFCCGQRIKRVGFWNPLISMPE